jgi:hypothetical protein
LAQVEIYGGNSPVLEVAEVTILPLGLLGVFPAVWKIGKFPHFLKGAGGWGGKRLSLDSIIFNTFSMFHLMTNTSKENREISSFLEKGGGEETIFRHHHFQHFLCLPLVDKYLKSWEGIKINTPHSTIEAS